MRTALQIARKDVRQRLRDRSAYVIGLVAPLGLALIIGNLIGNLLDEGGAAEAWQLAAVDEDGGPVAAAFLDQLAGIEEEGFIAVTLTDRTAADALVEADGVVAAFVLPAGFSEAVFAGQEAEIAVVGNPKKPAESTVAASLATGFADTLRMSQLSVGAALVASGEEATPDAIAALAAQTGEITVPISVAPYDEDFGGIDYTTYFAAGMTVFFSFFVVQFGILSLIEERDQGTLIRLLAAPIRPSSVLLGKVLGSFALGLASVTVMVVATTQLMGARWGDPLGVALLVVAGALAAVGCVAAIASFARTRDAARGYAELAAVVLGLLGGSFFVVGHASNLAAQVTWLSPHRWLLEGFQDLSAGDSALEILPYVGGVLVFALVTGGIGLLRSHRLVRLS